MINTLIYDIEIKNAIPSGDPIPGINYCKGWGDFEGMGIAVVGYQWNDEHPVAVSLPSFAFRLGTFYMESYVTIGFNSKRFDDALIKVNGFHMETNYDLLEEIRLAADHLPHRSPKGFTYKLDAIAQANGMAKNGSGALAPVLWQQGQHEQVKDYCKNDVVITKKMLDLGLAGELIDPNTGNKLQLRRLEDV